MSENPVGSTRDLRDAMGKSHITVSGIVDLTGFAGQHVTVTRGGEAYGEVGPGTKILIRSGGLAELERAGRVEVSHGGELAVRDVRYVQSYGASIYVRNSGFVRSNDGDVVLCGEASGYAVSGAVQVKDEASATVVGGAAEQYGGTLFARGNATIHYHGGELKGGHNVVVLAYNSNRHRITVPQPEIQIRNVVRDNIRWSVEGWLAEYNPEIKDGMITVYRGVRSDYSSFYSASFVYPYEGIVSCPDWSPEAECGNGLHFSASPTDAQAYTDNWVEDIRWLECRVFVDEFVPLGDKIKAPRCIVVGEVDISGRRLSE